MSTEATKTTAVAVKKNQLAKVEGSPADRFTQKVMALFPSGGDQKIQLTSLQKKLINNYFIKLDNTLKDSEVKRLATTDQYRDALEFSWQNVNMNKLAQDVVAFSEIGLDPLQPNHINPIPYKNKKTNKFDVTFIPGYDGIEIKAKRYGLDAPDDAIIQLVYSTDVFKSIKKDRNTQVESYDFEVTNDFDRGDLIGGFYYHIFKNDPTKNKLVVMSKKDIDKRKPDYASAEFWGGEKDKWVNGKKAGKEVVEGWYDEMAWKTVKRACWSSVNIDPSKIDENMQRLIQSEMDNASFKVEAEISANANQETIDIDYTEDAPAQNSIPENVDTETGEIKEESPKQGDQPVERLF